MLVEKCEMPDIFVDGSAISRFLSGSLGGAYEQDMEKYFSLLGRLIDKARHEYLAARNAAVLESSTSSIETIEIINHLENCINALARVYKIFSQIGSVGVSMQKSVSDVRNRIEHMDEDIAEGKTGVTSLNISSDAKSIEILGKSLNLVDLAKEIEVVHMEILKLFHKHSKIPSQPV